MNSLLLAVSISSVVLQNAVFNKVSKEKLKEKSDIYKFNLYTYLVAFALFLISALGESISFYTVALAVVFGLTTFVSYLFKMRALASGPMHITILITTASMIIPALSGAVMFGESFSFLKGVAIIFLIFFIFLSNSKNKSEKGIEKMWLMYCLITFVAQGTIGVLQKIHQASAHKNELGVFLAVSFICSVIFSSIMNKKSGGSFHLEKSSFLMACFCGICTFTMNFLNLKLSGIIPSQIFFPLVNGGAIILTALVSVVVFKEKLNIKQLAGLIGGILSLIAICIL